MLTRLILWIQNTCFYKLSQFQYLWHFVTVALSLLNDLTTMSTEKVFMQLELMTVHYI